MLQSNWNQSVEYRWKLPPLKILLRVLAADVAGDGLDLGVVLQPVGAELAAAAGLLVPAERGHRAEDIVTVDPHGAGPEGVRQVGGLLDILGEDGGGEAVAVLVGALGGLLDGGELLDGLDGAEDLLLADAHVVADVREDRGLEKNASK